MELPHCIDRTALRILNKTTNNELDLVVNVNAWKWSPPPVYDVVCAVHPRHVVLDFGSDGPINIETLQQHAPFVEVEMFSSRELLADHI